MDPATLAGIGIAVVSIFVMMILEGSNPMSIMLLAPMILVGGVAAVGVRRGVIHSSPS